MQIECPSCFKENQIDLGDDIVCHNCRESLRGHTYKKWNKPLISAFSAFVIGAVGTHQIQEHLIQENRYPVPLEYELIDSCINSSNRYITRAQTVSKKKACICALEKTLETISYQEINESETEFLPRFRDNALACATTF